MMARNVLLILFGWWCLVAHAVPSNSDLLSLNSHFVQQLNYYFPEINLSIPETSDPATAFEELQIFENNLRGNSSGEEDSLIQLACYCRPECGGVCHND